MLLFANSCFSADGYVGVQIEKKNDGFINIMKILPNSSAQKEGLYQQDEILKINNINTQCLSLFEARAMLRGESGTTVKVLVVNNGEQKEINLLRLAFVDSGIKIKKQEYNSFEIIKIYRNSGAATSGLLVGDKIIYIDKQNTKNLNEKDVKNLLYGFENSKKDIIIIRDGKGKRINLTLKDYQISKEEAQQILSDFKKGGYNLAYAIKNGKYDVINAYIVAGNTITIDMFEYALAYNQYDIANLMAKQNINMVREGNKQNKKEILLGVASIVTSNFLPATGLVGPLLGAGSDMDINIKERPNMAEELQSIKENSTNKENMFLFKAVDSNNANILNVYINANYDLSPALDYAISNKKEYMAKVMVEKGITSENTLYVPATNKITQEIADIDINFLGNLSYNTNIVDFLQKFNSYSTVKNITLKTKGVDTQKLSKFLGVDLNNHNKTYANTEEEALAHLQNIMNVMMFQQNISTMADLKELVAALPDIKSKNIKGFSTRAELLTILSNLYNANKKLLSSNISKVQNVDGKVNMIYKENIIIYIDEVVINNIPFEVQALFVSSIPYFQYEYKNIPKTANGIYWPHYLKELKLRSKNDVQYYGEYAKDVVNSYRKKYINNGISNDDYNLNIRGKDIDININSNNYLEIRYTNKKDFNKKYQDLVNKRFEMLEEQKMLKERQHYQSKSLDGEI